MAIERFQNKDILVSSKVPVSNVKVYSLTDESNLGAVTLQLESNDLVHSTTTSVGATSIVSSQNQLRRSISSVGGTTYNFETKVESHIYSADTLVSSNESELVYESNNTDTDRKVDILINPERDVRLSNIETGYYSLVYNFVKSLTPELKVLNINADSTEIELEVKGSGNLGKLLQRISQNEDELNTLNLGLNFGDNKIQTITDISFYNNDRIGERVQTVLHPIDNYQGESTVFVPSEEGKSQNQWIEFFLQKRQNNFGDYVYINTGRSAKFNVAINEDGNAYYQIEQDSNGDNIYYTSADNPEDRQYTLAAEAEYYRNPPINQSGRNSSSITRYSRVRYYNERFQGQPTNVIVKLYKPLEDGLSPLGCRINEMTRESYIERVLVYNDLKPEEQPNFSSPNFKIDLGNYGKSQGTDLKSWNDLLDTNLSTSQQIIDKYISGSFGGVDLNVDYTYFGNFVKYSSAVERVKNFKYKLELVESFDARIKTLESVSGSEALTNISQSISRRDAVVTGMDGWERWMYNEKTGSLYTHYTSSNYPIEPWPKQSLYPNVQYSVTSSQAESHYNGLIDSASIHDALNDARLTKVVPSSIVEDPLNKEYVLFVDMIGHHFDITWSYINALTSINERQEHPYDGMPNELLYDVAKSMGWKLTHGKDTANLWEFGLGTDKFGNTPNSGSLPSKSHEQINYEVWRRVVNTIPYLLKTKGSARAVKALIATYGIPQTFLSIREYGGPVIEHDVRPYWEHDRFVYHLRMDNNNYIEVPWDKVTDLDPVTYAVNDPNPIDVIELQVQQNMNRDTAILRKGSDFAVLYESTSSSATFTKGNIHFYLSGSSGYKSASINNVPLFDSNMSTLLIERENSVDDITKDNVYKLQYRRAKKDRITVSRSASISIDGSTESSYNAAWTGSGFQKVQFGKAFGTVPGAPSLWGDTNTMSGSIQEIRYWAEQLKDIVVDEHTLSRETYHGNSVTSSYFDLKFRFIPDSNLKTIDSYDSHASQHPNQQITTSQNGSILSASLFNFENDDLIGVTEEYYTKVPSAGANNILNNKVRTEANPLTSILNTDNKVEKSQYDQAPLDSNVLGVYLSATRMYNEDIYNHTGYFEIDDYIGNPDQRSGFTESNEELDYIRRQVFKKYSSKNLINNTIDILAKYDMTIFEQIRQTIPARVDYNSGILIEPHILERPKAKSLTKVTQTKPMYVANIAAIDRPVTASHHFLQTEVTNSYSLSAERKQYETEISKSYNVTGENIYYTSSIVPTRVITAQKDDLESVGNPQIKNMYAPSTYRYVVLNYSSSADLGFGLNWTTGSNGSWNYNPLGTNVTSSKLSQHAKSEVFFYTSSLSASLNLPYSSSFVPAEVSTDNLPLAINNLRYLGCKISSDSLTTNSTQTPDGKPVIEIFKADPNVLIKTSQTAEEGNLDVDTATGLDVLNIKDLIIDDDIYFKRLQQYRKELREFRRKIEKMIEIEDVRAEEFDERFEEQKKLRTLELERRKEFDIKNGFIE